jgi:hypothetical protein
VVKAVPELRTVFLSVCAKARENCRYPCSRSFWLIHGNLGLIQLKISRLYNILMYKLMKLVPYISCRAVQGINNLF